MQNRTKFLFNLWYLLFYLCMIWVFIVTIQRPNILMAVSDVIVVVLNYILVVMRIRVFDTY
nr:MAG TPA: hypothetical protein [Caudoviricetes sp.]